MDLSSDRLLMNQVILNYPIKISESTILTHAPRQHCFLEGSKASTVY
jgi:hypothetical protein